MGRTATEEAEAVAFGEHGEGVGSKGTDVTRSGAPGRKAWRERVWEVFLDNGVTSPLSQRTANSCLTAQSCSWVGVHWSSKNPAHLLRETWRTFGCMPWLRRAVRIRFYRVRRLFSLL